jgi:ABC-type multidrug transport system ATPase subunit
MITLEGVAARQAPLTLASLSLSWAAGVHAIVGTPADGGPLLLALVAGRARLRSGRVSVLGSVPTDAGVRPQIAFVPFAPSLPDALRVSETLRAAAEIRGEGQSDPVKRLAVLGVESLASRPVHTLAPEEARAVALAEAVTSSRVRVLLVEEPLAGLDPRAESRLPERLRARGQEGCAVLVATASLRDAGELADDHVFLRGGRVAGMGGSAAELSAFSADGVRMRIVSSDAQALLGAVASEDAVEAVARRDAAVVVRGRSVNALAEAVGRAVTISGVDVVEMRIELPSLDDARAAAGATP